jgi:hypothetical protein
MPVASMQSSLEDVRAFIQEYFDAWKGTCSFYEYDLATRKIPAGRIYFDLATLMRQIGVAA